MTGYLTPTAGTGKVFAAKPGTIETVFVNEGEVVAAGQPLFRIATPQYGADGQDVDAAILSTLDGQRRTLRSQIEAEEARVASERNRLTTAVRGLADGAIQLEAQIATQEDRIHLAESLVASALQLLEKGNIARVEYQRRQEGVLEQKQGLNALTRQLSQARNEIADTAAQLAQLPTVMAGKIQSLRGDLAAAEQRIAEFEGRRAYTVNASMTGRVSTLQAKPGQYAAPSRLQLEIVPQDSQLEAELFVPTRAIGFVRPGQLVRILYDAFPYQAFGVYRGTIRVLSHTIVTPADAGGAIAPKGPSYRAIVVLERPDIDANGMRVPLQADMTLRADIILEEQSLLRWLLAPALGLRGRS